MKITIITNEKRDPSLIYTKQAVETLCVAEAKVFGYNLDVPKATPCTAIPKDTDCLVILGGDGSIMRGAMEGVEFGIPVIGINLGKLGYLAELDVHQIPMLANIAAGKYKAEERMLLEVECGGQVFTALNDVVVSRRGAVQIAQLELSCSSGGTGVYRCDGLIVATPTGSTAYSMSAGGPIVDPALPSICVTPVCAHSLSARPMVFSPNEIITISSQSKKQSKLSLTVDGVEVLTPKPEQKIIVRRSANVVKFVRLSSTGFFDRLKTKL